MLMHMDITPYVDSLKRDLLAAAEGAGPEARQAAERLSYALDPAARLALMEAISQAAAEITAELPSGGVDVRLDGRDLAFVVHAPSNVPAPPAPPAPPMPGDDDEEGGLARITLRIPESVKTKAEDVAARSGQSLNTWLVNGRPGRDPRGRDQRRHRPVQHPVLRQRPLRGRQAARQPPHDRLGLAQHPPHHHPTPRDGRPAGPADEHTQETAMSSYEFETHEPVDLYVELGKGEVNVTASDTTATTVEVEGRDSERVEVRQDGRQISVLGPKGNRGLFGGEPSYEVTISLPTGSNTVIKTGSADITLDGTFGHGQIKSGSGDCTARHLRGPAGRRDRLRRHRTLPGRRRAPRQERLGRRRRRPGRRDLSVSTGSGDVEIGTTHGQAVVKTGSGDLEIGHASDGVSMSTGSGDMQIRTATKGKFSAKGASGDVLIGIPAGIPVWTDLTTVSGDIHSDLRGAGQPEPGADYIELRAKTVSGDIQLREV